VDIKEVATETWLLIGALTTTVAFVAVAVFSPHWFDPKPDWDVSDGCLGGLTHEETRPTAHYHPKIMITVDGNYLQIPENTGIDQTGCKGGMRWVHIHNVPDWENNPDYTTIHVETVGSKNVPLGSFFEIWEREGGPGLTDEKKFDINRNGVSDWEEYDITMKVNGEWQEGSLESYVMLEKNDGEKIELFFTSK
tara:strand:- start:401 stop:982 length:582 start_codon:yes stop_codon:yes gene_type:complete